MRLLPLVLLICFPFLARAEIRAAFVVGNSVYENAATLANPSRDAALVAATLEKLDFSVTLHSDLTRNEFSTALSEFLKSNSNADVTFFYYAGHGMQYAGENFLVGTDATLRSEFDIESETISLDKIVAAMERKSKAVLVFVDACRNNPLADTFYKENFSSDRAVQTRGLARVQTEYEGSMLVFAASPGQVASDGNDRNSPFALALSEHLPSENVEVLSLMKRIIRDVKVRTDGHQIPTVTNDLTREIYLRQVAYQPVSPAIKIEEEKAVFEAAGSIDTLDGWAHYFAKYPNGRFNARALDAEINVLEREVAFKNAEWKQSKSDVVSIQEFAKEIESWLGIGNDDAVLAQVLLRRSGFYSGTLDGALGRQSRDAIRKFQADRNLPNTGILTRATTAELGMEAKQVSQNQFVSSLRAQKIDWKKAKLLGLDPRIVELALKFPSAKFIYGFFEGRLYVAVSSSYGIGHRHFPDDKIGGYLVSVDSAKENKFIYDLVRYDPRLWSANSIRTSWFGPLLGLAQDRTAKEPNGGWHWPTDKDSGFRRWSSGEPNDHNGNEDSVTLALPYSAKNGTPDLKFGATWNDMPGSVTGYIIEFE